MRTVGIPVRRNDVVSFCYAQPYMSETDYQRRTGRIINIRSIKKNPPKPSSYRWNDWTFSRRGKLVTIQHANGSIGTYYGLRCCLSKKLNRWQRLWFKVCEVWHSH